MVSYAVKQCFSPSLNILCQIRCTPDDSIIQYLHHSTTFVLDDISCESTRLLCLSIKVRPFHLILLVVVAYQGTGHVNHIRLIAGYALR